MGTRTEDGWVAVAPSAELDATGRALVLLNGRHIALFLVDGKLHAIDNQCPHARGPLEDGLLGTLQTDDGPHPSLSCPWHHATFDLVTGRVRPGCETSDSVEVFESRLAQGMIWLRGVTPRPPAAKLS